MPVLPPAITLRRLAASARLVGSTFSQIDQMPSGSVGSRTSKSTGSHLSASAAACKNAWSQFWRAFSMREIVAAVVPIRSAS